MTPEKKAIRIYLSLYKEIGCEAKTKRVAKIVLPEIFKLIGGDWNEVEQEIKKL